MTISKLFVVSTVNHDTVHALLINCRKTSPANAAKSDEALQTSYICYALYHVIIVYCSNFSCNSMCIILYGMYIHIHSMHIYHACHMHVPHMPCTHVATMHAMHMYYVCYICACTTHAACMCYAHPMCECFGHVASQNYNMHVKCNMHEACMTFQAGISCFKHLTKQ